MLSTAHSPVAGNNNATKNNAVANASLTKETKTANSLSETPRTAPTADISFSFDGLDDDDRQLVREEVAKAKALTQENLDVTKEVKEIASENLNETKKLSDGQKKLASGQKELADGQEGIAATLKALQEDSAVAATPKRKLLRAIDIKDKEIVQKNKAIVEEKRKVAMLEAKVKAMKQAEKQLERSKKQGLVDEKRRANINNSGKMATK